MIIDTHSHLNFAAYDNDRDEVIKKCLENDIWMINVGTNYATSRKAVKIAEKYKKGVYAAIGLHPINLDTELMKIKVDLEELSEDFCFEKEFNYEQYKKIGKSKKVVAVGEIGLDYWRRPKNKRKKELFKQKQKELLKAELCLARELNLPVIFHCRLALDELIAILEFYLEHSKIQLRGVIHCFTGNWRQAKEFIKMGFHLGFNGIIFKMDLNEVIKKVSLDKILIETDCPYLTPPEFKEKRNNPFGAKYVAREIAKVKDMDFQKVINVATVNAKNLFKI